MGSDVAEGAKVGPAVITSDGVKDAEVGPKVGEGDREPTRDGAEVESSDEVPSTRTTPACCRDWKVARVQFDGFDAPYVGSTTRVPLTRCTTIDPPNDSLVYSRSTGR